MIQPVQVRQGQRLSRLRPRYRHARPAARRIDRTGCPCDQTVSALPRQCRHVCIAWGAQRRAGCRRRVPAPALMLSAPAGRAAHRRFAAQLLGALRFMAQQRVVHCDLKPENILLVEPNKARIKARADPVPGARIGHVASHAYAYTARDDASNPNAPCHAGWQRAWCRFGLRVSVLPEAPCVFPVYSVGAAVVHARAARTRERAAARRRRSSTSAAAASRTSGCTPTSRAASTARRRCCSGCRTGRRLTCGAWPASWPRSSPATRCSRARPLGRQK